MIGNKPLMFYFKVTYIKTQIYFSKWHIVKHGGPIVLLVKITIVFVQFSSYEKAIDKLFYQLAPRDKLDKNLPDNITKDWYVLSIQS